MQISIVSTSDRPDLVPTVALWLWEAFWRNSGYSLEHTLQTVGASVTARSMPRTVIMLADGEAVGTASLVAEDLDERSDLMPLLASVFVEPRGRGQGYAGRLISAVEQEARGAAIPTLWLYTNTAENIYARAGWQRSGTVQHCGKPFALMRRDLLEQS